MLDASDILGRMRALYKAASTYRDTGRIVCVAASGDAEELYLGRFETTFVRETDVFSFRFAQSNGDVYAIRSEHGRVVDESNSLQISYYIT